MHRALEFLLHRLRSHSRHGVHSPFVYELIDLCIYASNPQPDPKILDHFKSLRNDQTMLEGFDFGQGKHTTRRVSDYARSSSISDFQAKLLYRLVMHLQAKKVLELGSNLGKTTAVVASAENDVKVRAVEGNSELCERARASLKHLELTNAHVEHKSFDDFFTGNTERFDFVFLDGDHRYEPTMRYYQQIKMVLEPSGVIVLHDIYHSSEMRAAWEDIKKDQAVKVSLDLFFFGLIWFNREQARQDFSIRFPKSLLHLAL